MRAECSIDDCGEKPIGRGMCRYHYRRWARWDESDPRCTEDGCQYRQWAKGLCVLHYERASYRRRSSGLCSTDGCERHAQVKGLCRVHYQTGRPRAKKAKPTAGPCSLPGCDELTVGRGLCERHYRMWRAAQSPSVAGYCATCEDIEFMVRAGEVAEGVAARSGLEDRKALRIHLTTHGRADLWEKVSRA